MIIQIGGKKQAGKDTAAAILQFIFNNHGFHSIKFDEFIKLNVAKRNTYANGTKNKGQVKSYAHKLKVHVANMLNVSIDKFEDNDWKNTELGEEWRYIKVVYDPSDGDNIGDYETLLFANKADYNSWLNSYDRYVLMVQSVTEHYHTPRTLMQYVSTEVCRQIHPNYWVNGLFIDYKALNPDYAQSMGNVIDYSRCDFPNWIIKDCRFKNELEYPKLHKYPNFSIYIKGRGETGDAHRSENELSEKDFDYVINNNSTIHNLYIELLNIAQINRLI